MNSGSSTQGDSTRRQKGRKELLAQAALWRAPEDLSREPRTQETATGRHMKAKDGQNQQCDAQWRTKEGSEAGSMA